MIAREISEEATLMIEHKDQIVSEISEYATLMAAEDQIAIEVSEEATLMIKVRNQKKLH